MKHFPGSHTSEEIKRCFVAILQVRWPTNRAVHRSRSLGQEWGIYEKVYATTADGASNMQSGLLGALPQDQAWIVWCHAHVLNLLVRDALKAIQTVGLHVFSVP